MLFLRYMVSFSKIYFHLKREEVCIKTRSTSASRTNRSFKQPRFWLTHVNRKWAFFSFNMRWRYQICIVRCLYLYRDDLPQNLLKKSTSGWRAKTSKASLKQSHNAIRHSTEPLSRATSIRSIERTKHWRQSTSRSLHTFALKLVCCLFVT